MGSKYGEFSRLSTYGKINYDINNINDTTNRKLIIGQRKEEVEEDGVRGWRNDSTYKSCSSLQEDKSLDPTTLI